MPPRITRLDRIKALNQCHQNAAQYIAQGKPRDEVLRLTQLREDKFNYLLQNPIFLKRVKEIKTSLKLPSPAEADRRERDSMTLAQLATAERKQSVKELASIRDTSDSDTARVAAASAIINQTKDIAVDDGELDQVATEENTARILRAIADIKWFVEDILKRDPKPYRLELTTPSVSLKANVETQEQEVTTGEESSPVVGEAYPPPLEYEHLPKGEEDANGRDTSESGDEVQNRPEAGKRNNGQVPVRV